MVPLITQFGPLGWTELIIIVFIIVLLFGARRIPELMKSLGRGVREFRKGMSGMEEEMKKTEKEIKSEETVKEVAKKLGIKTEGKSTEELAKEIVEKGKKEEAKKE